MKLPKECEGCLTSTHKDYDSIYCSAIDHYKICPCTDCLLKSVCQSICDKYMDFDAKRHGVTKGDLYSDTT